MPISAMRAMEGSMDTITLDAGFGSTITGTVNVSETLLLSSA